MNFPTTVTHGLGGSPACLFGPLKKVLGVSSQKSLCQALATDLVTALAEPTNQKHTQAGVLGFSRLYMEGPTGWLVFFGGPPCFVF